MQITKVALVRQTELPPRSGKFYSNLKLGVEITGATMLASGWIEVAGLGDGNIYAISPGTIAYVVSEPTSSIRPSSTPTVTPEGGVVDASTATDFSDEPTVVTKSKKAKKS